MEMEGRPHCSACGVDMWLTHVLDGTGSADSSYVFECKVCGAQETQSSAPGGMPGLEERL